MPEKTVRKTLTDAAGAAVIFSVLSFIAASLGMLLEPVGYYVHKNAFERDIGLFSGKSWYSWFNSYDRHLILFIIAFAMLVICGRERKLKKLGRDLAALITLLSGALCCVNGTALYSAVKNDVFDRSWPMVLLSSIDPDMGDFDRTMAMLYYIFPLAASGALLVTGVILWIRTIHESYSVECPPMTEVESSKPVPVSAEEVAVQNESAPVVKREPEAAAAAAPAPIAEAESFAEPLSEPEQETVIEPEPVPEPEPVKASEPEKQAEPVKQSAAKPKNSAQRRPQNRNGQKRTNRSPAKKSASKGGPHR